MPLWRIRARNSGASGGPSQKCAKATGFPDCSITGSMVRARAICSCGAPGMKAVMSPPIAGSASSAAAVVPNTSGLPKPMVVRSSGLSTAA